MVNRILAVTFKAVTPNWVAVTSLRDPWYDPIGVLAALTITTERCLITEVVLKFFKFTFVKRALEQRII